MRRCVFLGIMVGRGPGKQLEEETERALFENMRMCLGTGTVFADKTHCTVSFSGVESKVNTRLLPDCSVGDFVLVHAGYAIEKVDPGEAENTLDVFRQLNEEMRK